MRMKSSFFYTKSISGVATCLCIGVLWISSSFADSDSIVPAREEPPPTGNGPFYTGMGLTLGGIAYQILGAWVIAANLEEEVEYGPRDIYGDPYDSTVTSNTIPIVFGIGCIVSGTGMEIFGIPRLVKGSRLKEKRREWLKRTEVSIGYNHRDGTCLLKSRCFF